LDGFVYGNWYKAPQTLTSLGLYIKVLDVANEIKDGQVKRTECIQCGVCIDNCSRNVLSYGKIERRGKYNGNRKKA